MSELMKNQYFPDNVSPPGETLSEILTEKGMSQAEFAERTGRPRKTINEIIKGKAAITPDTAIQFERVLGTPIDFWLTREQNYRAWLARQESKKNLAVHLPWMKKFPIRSMIRMGWIPERFDPIDQLEELLKYLGVASPVQWQAMIQGTQWRQSPTFTADPAAVTVWLRQGEIQSQGIDTATYDEDSFRNSLNVVRGMTTYAPEIVIREITRVCAEAGVAVVFVPEITGTRTCGATRWLSPSKALIMLSLRYKTDDHLWFTFFHEAGHILLHGKRDVFIEDDQDLSNDGQEKEEEADRFSADFLIPRREMAQFAYRGRFFSHDDVISFAQRVGIAPGIVVGRLQHDGLIPPQNLNGLKKRFRWNI